MEIQFTKKVDTIVSVQLTSEYYRDKDRYFRINPKENTVTYIRAYDVTEFEIFAKIEKITINEFAKYEYKDCVESNSEEWIKALELTMDILNVV